MAAGSIVIDLLMKTGSFETDTKRAAGSIKRFEKQAKDSSNAVATSFKNLGASLLAATSVVASVRSLVTLGDTFTSLNARLSLAVSNTLEFAIAQEELFNIAQRSRAGLENTTTLYASLARSTRQLGVSQKELLRVTETINQALIISGGSAESAAAALIQLGQGLSSGTLQGEELRSVLEQAPRLAQAIADGLGVTVDQLRKLGEEGQLTSTRVFEAIQKSGAQINKEFGTLPTTVGQSLTQVGNSVLRLVGQLDQAAGATNAIARAFTGISRFIDSFGNVPETVNVGLLARDVVKLNKELTSLRARKDSPFNFVGDIDKQIAEVEQKLKAAKVRFNAADRARSGTLFSADDQGSAEARRLGLIPAARVQKEEESKQKRKAAQRISDADRYLQSLLRQLDATKELSAVQELQLALERGELGKITPIQLEKLRLIAEEIDLNKTLKEEQQLRINAGRESAIAELDALTKANEEFDQFVKNAIGATPTGRLEEQRMAVMKLTEAYELGRFGIVGSAEAVALYGETVNQFLGNLDEKGEKVKTLGEEIGLTFTSAFEDAIVTGQKLSDVINSLGQDILRITTRKLITEPIGGFFTDALKGLGGGGNLLGSIGSAISGLFGGSRAGGGDVMSGRSYLVGEQGPEMFVPRTAGTIVPNQRGQDSGGRVINVNVTAVPNMTRDSALQQGARIAQGLNLALARNG